MIEMFTDVQIADILKDKIMHPSNAIPLQRDVHDSFGRLLWSIEAVKQLNNYIVMPSLKCSPPPPPLVLTRFGIAIYIQVRASGEPMRSDLCTQTRRPFGVRAPSPN
jgi:hypothetical protein